MNERPHVLIVGAGIVGASIAWHLVRAGARVSVLDAGAPGGLATRASWAWINASRGNPEPYFRLRVRAMAEWRRLEREVPGIRVAWSGGLLWDLSADELEAFAAEHAAWGYDIRLVGRAEAARIEPQLADPPACAIHAAGEGAVEPLAAAQALLDAAVTAGATLQTETPVRALDLAAGRVSGVVTDGGCLAADEVVLAAGVETAALTTVAGLNLPMTVPPGLLVATRPCARLLNGLVMAPGLHVRQTADGRPLAGADFGGSDPGADPAVTAEAVLEDLKALLKGGRTLALDRYQVGFRPTPADGFPAVGRVDGVPGLHVAVMHSGVTLAPAIGRFVAEELLEGRRDPLLFPYGLDRFA